LPAIDAKPRSRSRVTVANCPSARDIAAMSNGSPWPTEIRLRKDRRSLAIQFDDGVSHDLPAEMLRVLSPSAEVQGHSPEQRKTVGGKRDVSIAAIDPVGNYAVRLTFDDGHNTGLFSWTYLRQLGDEHDQRWQSYLNELASKGMSRDR
jgi:DUF971 family protein